MAADEFTGTERFELVRRLGEGGMGVVYEAFDRARAQRVALKTLSRLDPVGIYQLKQEFRSLADLVHPNLVVLHELFVQDEKCFFTMELVDGVDFVEHVRQSRALAYEDTQAVGAPARRVLSSRPRARSRKAALDPSRLRESLGQLARGVQAIHLSGKLHCDLKPSNILVTAEGRVVILDFGLAVEQVAAVTPSGDIIGGTPEYMAPEQALQGIATPASDWYAFGVVLYEALTGTLPFAGFPALLFTEKMSRDPPPPSARARDVPEDLERLCVELLNRRPDERPGAQRILAQVATSGVTSFKTSATPSVSPQESVFVGREPELAVLRQVFVGMSDEKGPVSAFVHGLSGMGKTALVTRFLAELGADAIILRGRCYERESVPFKALDSVIDAVSRYLINLPPRDMLALLPHDMSALGRVFPVLRRVVTGQTAELAELAEQDAEPRVLRNRAFAALKTLLRRIGQRAPLVAFIDDIQWGDADSARLVAELLVPPDPPLWFFIGAYRTGDRDSSPFLNAFADAFPNVEAVPHIFVGPLDGHQARQLADALLSRNSPARAGDRADTIARESAGSPFFISELATHLEIADELGSLTNQSPELSLERALLSRVELLSPSSKQLLEVCCLAGRPVDERVVIETALVDDDPYTALASLKAARLIRGVGDRTVETYHDRIREAVTATVLPQRSRQCHLRLATSLEKRSRVDPEVLVEHFQRGGDTQRAGRYAREAARRASEALAFDQAARLYRLALELRPATRERERDLQLSLARALSSAGRGAEAARAFLDAASDAPAARASELRRRAAEQLLRSGFVDEGMGVLREALEETGITLPPSDDALRVRSRELGSRLRERGLSFVERSDGALRPEEAARLEVCWSAAQGLATIDGARAELMALQHLLDALDAGPPARVLRALALHVLTSGARPESRRVAAVLSAADSIAARLGSADATGWTRYAHGVADFWQGRPRGCLRNIGDAERLWREVPGGRARELSMARMAMNLSLTLLGDIAELGRMVPRWLEEAAERDDLYLSTMLRAHQWAVALAADEPDKAVAEADDALARWGRGGFDVLMWEALLTRVNVALYEGRPSLALRLLSERWEAILQSNIGLATQFRALTFDARARATLSLVADGDDAASLERVRRDAGEVAALRLPCALPHAPLLRAGAAKVEGNVEEAVSLLAEAEDGLSNEQGNPLTLASARRQRGILVGGEEGARLVRWADDALRARGVVSPRRWAAFDVPGF